MKLNKLYQLIDEALNKPKKDDCGCTGGDAPLLTESKVKDLLSEGLQYHIDKKVPLHNTIYRYGSEKHLLLVKEARRMYSRGVISLSEEDKQLVSTNLGEFGIYEGKEVPLDLPMVSELYEKAQEIIQEIRIDKAITDGSMTRLKQQIKDNQDLAQIVLDFMVELNRDKNLPEDYGLKQAVHYLSKVAGSGGLTAPNASKRSYKYAKDSLKIPKDIFDLKKDITLDEKKKSTTKKKKDPPIGKPKRGGSKAYYVYVRDPKTKRIKKVSFGSGGLRAKIKNRGARAAFAKRHRCSEKNDRTKASYWSCRLPRYAQALGLGSNSNTFW